MGENHWTHERFIVNLLKASRSKNLEEAAREWKVGFFDYDEEALECQLCNRHRVKNYVMIENAINKNKLDIGWVCYDKLLQFLVTNKVETPLVSRDNEISSRKKSVPKELRDRTVIGWLKEQKEKNLLPIEIDKAMTVFLRLGFTPTIEAGEKIVEYYKNTRLFNIDNLIDEWDLVYYKKRDELPEVITINQSHEIERLICEDQEGVRMAAEARKRYLHGEFLEAAKRGYHKKIMRVASHPDVDIDYRDKDGKTALWLALEKEKMEIVKFLIEKGVDLETESPSNQFPLIWAIMYDDAELFNLLIENGANLKIRDNHNLTPLDWAIKSDNLQFAQQLIEEGVEYDGHLLVWAIGMNRIEISIFLIKKGIDLEYQDLLGQTPLLHAIEIGSADLTRLLIKKGAKLETGDKNGNTPLFWAVCKSDINLVNLLVEKGANLESIDDNSNTSLILAIKRNKTVIIERLIQGGANLEAVDNDGNTPLLLAIQGNNSWLIKILLENGAKIDKSGTITAFVISSDKKTDSVYDYGKYYGLIKVKGKWKNKYLRILNDLEIDEDGGAYMVNVIDEKKEIICHKHVVSHKEITVVQIFVIKKIDDGGLFKQLDFTEKSKSTRGGYIGRLNGKIVLPGVRLDQPGTYRCILMREKSNYIRVWIL